MAKANSTASRRKRASAQSDFPVLKCRKGDLAIILGDSRFAGYMVAVGKYHGMAVMSDGKVMSNAWRVLHSFDNSDTQFFTEDRYLLPIRPGDLDETETDDLPLTQGRSA